jgi:LacI family transcriptional regulator
LAESGIVSISANNFGGGYAAAQHLLELGHRRVGLMIGRQDSAFARERYHGMAAAFRDTGLSVPAELVREATFTAEAGLAAARHLLALRRPPTAIIANCDGAGLGVLVAANELGLSVPGDLSVVGFDGTVQSRWSVPQLTTVAQPLADMGRLAIRSILGLIKGERPYSPHLQLATSLIEGASTAPPQSEKL